jgi:ribosome maturation factor RimP
MEDLQEHVEERIADLDPRIELIALERAGGDDLRIYIDHPDGVGLDLCERVTGQLAELLADYGLEVSSPGLDRPLTKPAHFQRFLGREVKVRTTRPQSGSKSFKGRLSAATEASISVEDERGETEIPLADVHRANLVPEPAEVSR